MGDGNSTLTDGELLLRPAVPEDLDLLAAWFTDPEVYGWWGGEPLSRETVAAKYVGARRPTVESLIVEQSGRPIGYAQFHAEDQRGGGLDMVLLPELRDQGIGSRAARLLVRHLRERLGWQRITVDPAVDNHRAIHAWEKAGFQAERIVPDGPGGPSLLMLHEQPSLANGPTAAAGDGEDPGQSDSGVDDAHAAGREVGRVLVEALGEDLLAVYVHGSAVLGGFRWDRSDLDLLALSHGALSDRQLDRVVQVLTPLNYPVNGLEFTLMTAQEALQPQLPAPRFQLHQTTNGLERGGKAVDGRQRDGDPDLVLHLAVCRERGSTIIGPPPRSSLAVIPAEAIELAMRDEVRWARAHAPLEYLVLTSARAWLFAETRRIVSKIEAGEWAAERYAEPAVIEAALARQRGATTASVPKKAAERFAEHVMNMAGRP